MKRVTIQELSAEVESLKRRLYEAEAENLQRRQKRSRPGKLRGTTSFAALPYRKETPLDRKETPLGVAFININEDDKNQPFEVFITLGKAGGSAMADAIGIALDDWWRDKAQGVQQDAFTTAEFRNSVNHRLRPARTVGRSRSHVGASRAYRTVRHPASSPGQ